MTTFQTKAALKEHIKSYKYQSPSKRGSWSRQFFFLSAQHTQAMALDQIEDEEAKENSALGNGEYINVDGY